MICLVWVLVECSELSDTGEESWALNPNVIAKTLSSLTCVLWCSSFSKCETNMINTVQHALFSVILL